MNKYLIPLFAAIFLFTACEKDNIQPQDASLQTDQQNSLANYSNPCAWTFDFYAGQNIPAGTITISNDSDYIYVTYNTSGLAFLYETHLHVGGYGSIPTNNAGNPQIGQFQYSEVHNGITTYTYTIPIDPDLDCYVVAAHASVLMAGENGEPGQQETAWINSCFINEGGSWAGYAKYCLQDCD